VITHGVMPVCTSANAAAVEREPGEIHASRTPARASAAANPRMARALGLAAVVMARPPPSRPQREQRPTTTAPPPWARSTIKKKGDQQELKAGPPSHLAANAAKVSGIKKERGLAYAGSAFIALSGNKRHELSARLAMSELEHSPIPKLRFADAHWVKPQLTARVRYLAGSSYLLHATLRGISRA